MAAGRLGDAQYVLLMRYDYPVIFADRTAVEEAGLDLERLCADLYTLYDALLVTSDPGWYQGLNRFILDPFADIFDYDTGSIPLSEAQLADYLRRITALRGSAYIEMFMTRGQQKSNRIS